MARRRRRIRRGVAGRFAKRELGKAFRAGEITQNQYDRLREELGNTGFGFVRKQRKAGKIDKDKLRKSVENVRNTLDQGKAKGGLKKFQDLLSALEASKSKTQEKRDKKKTASIQPVGGGTRFDSNPAKEFYEQQQAAKNEAFNAVVEQQQSQPAAQPVATQSAAQPATNQPAAKPGDKYQQTLSELKGSFEAGNINESQYEQLKGELAQERFGPKANMGQFNKLLKKLEGSKMRQQRQRSVEGRRDIFAGGLANMMSNF